MYSWGKAPSELVLTEQQTWQEAKLNNDLSGQYGLWSAY